MQWYRKASQEAPNTREPWVAMADLAHRMRAWQTLVYTMDPSVWGTRPHDLAALSAWNLEKYEDALTHGRIACRLEPDNERLSANLVFYEEKFALENPSQA